MLRIYLRPHLRERGIDYSDTHLRRLENAGIFPERVKLVLNSGKQGRVGWPAEKVDAYIAKVIAAAIAEDVA